MASARRVYFSPLAHTIRNGFPPRPCLLPQAINSRSTCSSPAFVAASPRLSITSGSAPRRTQTTYAGYVPGSQQQQQQQHGYPGPPPRRRSLPVRILWKTIKYTTVILFVFSGGVAVGFLTFPHRTAFLAAVAPRPSDAQTLTLYVAPDANTAAINEAVMQHPLARSLRADPAFTESRPHMKIPVVLRPTNLTGGTLAGPGKIAVPPVIFSEAGGKSLVSIFYLGEQLCGHPGLVHGGLLATLLDEGLARCCFPALPNRLGVTANLKIDYRKPSRAPGLFVLRAETTKVEGRKAWVKGWIESLEEGQEGVKLVEAEALFIEPRNAQTIRKLYAD